jgi:hypothetical protein
MTEVYTNSAQVYNLPRTVYVGTDEPLSTNDPIYPRKTQVKVGSVFSFHGHRQSKITTWIIEAIYTETLNESGKWVEHYLAHVKTKDNVVVLRCEETRQTKRIMFSWLAISAAWRLKPKLVF